MLTEKWPIFDASKVGEKGAKKKVLIRNACLLLILLCSKIRGYNVGVCTLTVCFLCFDGHLENKIATLQGSREKDVKRGKSRHVTVSSRFVDRSFEMFFKFDLKDKGLSVLVVIILTAVSQAFYPVNSSRFISKAAVFNYNPMKIPATCYCQYTLYYLGDFFVNHRGFVVKYDKASSFTNRTVSPLVTFTGLSKNSLQCSRFFFNSTHVS